MRPVSALPAVLAALVVFSSCAQTSTGVEEPTAEQPTEPAPNPPTVPRGEDPASLTLVSGGFQDGTTKEETDPMVVRVEDSRGVRVEHAAVQWTLVKGDGRLSGVGTSTDQDGEAQAQFIPSSLGQAVVEARVDGVSVPVSFQVNTTGYEISIYEDGFFTEDFAPDPTHADVPLGTRLAFKNRSHDQTVHSVVYVSGPGRTFFSDLIPKDERYDVTPSAAGTYQLKCGLHPSETVSVTVY